MRRLLLLLVVSGLAGEGGRERHPRPRAGAARPGMEALSSSACPVGLRVYGGACGLRMRIVYTREGGWGGRAQGGKAAKMQS